jgi:hypothetical protein
MTVAVNDQTRFRRRALQAVGLVSLLLVALLAYTLLQGDEKSPLNPIAAAAEQTQTYLGARYTMEGQSTSEALKAPISGEGRGAYNTVTGRGELKFWLDVPGLGEVEYETVNDEGELFVRSDNEVLMPLPDGKDWMKLEPFLGGSQTELMVGNDPDSTLQMLAAFSGDVRELGQETVDGRETERYRASFHLTDIAKALREDGKTEMAELYEKYGELNPNPTMVEAWIDDEEVLRQMRIVAKVPVEHQPPVTTDMTMEFFDYGAEPEVTLPDEDVVFDATPILEEKLEETEGD